jgi:hypothetical protein
LYNSYSDEKKIEALNNLNQAWSEFENSAKYINDLSNQDSYDKLTDIYAQRDARIAVDAIILEENAQEAENKVLTMQADIRRENILNPSFPTSKINSSENVLSLEDLINNQSRSTHSQTQTTFSHTSSLANELEETISDPTSKIPIPQPPQVQTYQPNQHVQNIPLPPVQNLSKQPWKPTSNLIRPSK